MPDFVIGSLQLKDLLELQNVMLETLMKSSFSDKNDFLSKTDAQKVDELAANYIDWVYAEKLDGSRTEYIQDEDLPRNFFTDNATLLEAYTTASLGVKDAEHKVQKEIDTLQTLKKAMTTAKTNAQTYIRARLALDKPEESAKSELEQDFDTKQAAFNSAGGEAKVAKLNSQVSLANKAKESAWSKLKQKMLEVLPKETISMFAYSQYQLDQGRKENEINSNFANILPAASAQLTVSDEPYTAQNITDAKTMSMDEYINRIGPNNYSDLIVSEALIQGSKDASIRGSKMLHVPKANALWLGTLTVSHELTDKTEAERQQIKAKHPEYEFHEQGLGKALAHAIKQRQRGESVVFNTLSVVAPDRFGQIRGGGHFEFFELREVQADPLTFLLLNANSTQSRMKDQSYIPDPDAPNPTLDLVSKIIQDSGISLGETRCHCLYDQSGDVACGVAATSTMLQRLLGTPGYPATTPIEKIPKREGAKESTLRTEHGVPINEETKRRLEHGSILANSEDEMLQLSLFTTGANASCQMQFLDRDGNALYSAGASYGMINGYYPAFAAEKYLSTPTAAAVAEDSDLGDPYVADGSQDENEYSSRTFSSASSDDEDDEWNLHSASPKPNSSILLQWLATPFREAPISTVFCLAGLALAAIGVTVLSGGLAGVVMAAAGLLHMTPAALGYGALGMGGGVSGIAAGLYALKKAGGTEGPGNDNDRLSPGFGRR